MLLGAFRILGHILGQLGTRQDGSGVDQIGASLVNSYHIRAAEHTDIVHDGHIVFAVAVAVRRNVHDETDMELGFAVHDSRSIFGHAFIHQAGASPVNRRDGVGGTQSQAPAAAYAFFHVDGALMVGDTGGAVSANLDAVAAAHAFFLVHHHLAVGVHLHLAGPAAAAHTDILNGAAEPGHLVALKVGQGNNNIRIGQSVTDFSFLHKFAVGYGEQSFVRAFQTVGDNHMAVRAQRVKAVLIRNVQMFQGVLAGAHIQSVTVRQERFAAGSFYRFHNHPGILRPQESYVVAFAKMHLDGYKFIFKINLVKARLFHQLGQFYRQRIPAVRHMKICKINLRLWFAYLFCLRHDVTSRAFKNCGSLPPCLSLFYNMECTPCQPKFKRR